MSLRALGSAALGAILTAGLCYGCWWVWTWAEKEIKGTPFGAFRFFGSLLAVFLLLSLAQLLLGWGERLLTRRARAKGRE